MGLLWPAMRGGETQWNYLVGALGFPSRRTAQRWRKELMGEMHMRPGLFDGGEDHLQELMALIGTMLKKTGHVGCMKGTIGCDGISTVADVSMDEDGSCMG